VYDRTSTPLAFLCDSATRTSTSDLRISVRACTYMCGSLPAPISGAKIGEWLPYSTSIFANLNLLARNLPPPVRTIHRKPLQSILPVGTPEPSIILHKALVNAKGLRPCSRSVTKL